MLHYLLLLWGTTAVAHDVQVLKLGESTTTLRFDDQFELHKNFVSPRTSDSGIFRQQEEFMSDHLSLLGVDLENLVTTLRFDDQFELHKTFVSPRTSDSSILRLEEFMSDHLSLLGVNSENLVHLHDSHAVSVGTTISHYNQHINSIKVFGSRVAITFGRQGGVIKATGSSLLLDSNAVNLAASSIITNEVSAKRLRSHIEEKYNTATQPDVEDGAVSELVYYRQNLGSDRLTGSPTLACHFKGTTFVEMQGAYYGVSYDAFVDAQTGVVIDYFAKDPIEEESKQRALRSNKRYRSNLRLNLDYHLPLTTTTYLCLYH